MGQAQAQLLLALKAQVITKMTPRRLFLIAVAVLCLGLITPAAAQSIEPWLHFDRAIADVTWVTEHGEHRDELQGTFSWRAPDEFSLAYQMGNLSMRRVRAYRNFTMTQYQGQTSYGYSGFPLFSIWQQFFWPLTQIHAEPLVYVGQERVAHREVRRYYLETDPQKVYWIDQQTNIPLLIMEGQQAVLSVSNYRFDSGAANRPRFLELDYDYGGITGKLTLWWGDFGAWVPNEIVLKQGQNTTTVSFSNWEVNTDQVGDLSVLKTLEWEIRLGEAAHNVGQWKDVLTSFKKVLSIDPYYLPAYFYLGHTYYTQGNYLGAVENYQQALMLDPNNALALNNLAYAYLERRVNLVQAVQMAEQAVAQERKATYLDTLGYGYYLQGRLEEARKILEEALVRIDETITAANVDEIKLHLEMVYHAMEKEGAAKS